ncbi:SDR family NAD(P)-dependent oxidoreductase [Hydrogenophaga sp.]|uniref:SDR family NAD(P)-dependent oxidoreductase n=1 Tax=Hydrogenophaga sp. TaxID=1904254 RepID=UPI003F712BB2
MSGRAAIQNLTIITGASKGLGLAMAMRLLGPDHALLCISRSTSGALAAEAALHDAPLQQLSLDLSDARVAATHIRAWLEAQELGSLSTATLINNAGTVGRPGPLEQAESDDLVRSLRVGLEAPLVLTAAFLHATRYWRVLRRVLNISSGLGRHAIAGQGSYCAAKAGMDHFSRAVAAEEAAKAHGARIVSLAPGVIDTDMQSVLRQTDAALLPDRSHYERLKAEGRLDTPDSAAEKVLRFLYRADFGSAVVAGLGDA